MTQAQAARQQLGWLLRHVQPILSDPAMTDFHINGVGDGRAFADRGKGSEQITLPYSWEDLDRIAINAARLTGQDISDETPIVTTEFPGGLRVQIVRRPAVPDGDYAFSVRQPTEELPSFAGLEAQGVFSRTVARRAKETPRRSRLLELHKAGRWREFLELAVGTGLNIVFSGPVGTGKTHVMRAATRCLPLDWRIITIEDLRELLGLIHRNVVHLMYSKGEQSVARVTSDDLVEAALRMSMQVMINQELRDRAAYSFMSVLDSGHTGLTTTHAFSAEHARERIFGLIKGHPEGKHLNDESVRASLYSSIDVVVHCARDGGDEDGFRYVEQILYDPEVKDRYANRHSLFLPPSRPETSHAQAH